jgi:hypothetical protein
MINLSVFSSLFSDALKAILSLIGSGMNKEELKI